MPTIRNSFQTLLVLAFTLSPLFAEPLTLNKLDNAEKEKLSAEAGKLLATPPSSGTLVLDLKYFQENLTKKREVTQVADDIKMREKVNVSVDDLRLKVIESLLVAKEMLAAAQQPSSAEALKSWNARRPDVLAAHAPSQPGKPDEAIFSDELGDLEFWKSFLDEWQQKAIIGAPERFNDALRQAAISIVRVALDEERAQIDAVQKGTSAPPGSGTPGLAAASSGAYGKSYHPIDVIHERLMSGIYRRHDRRVAKVDRIVSRR